MSVSQVNSHVYEKYFFLQLIFLYKTLGVIHLSDGKWVVYGCKKKITGVVEQEAKCGQNSCSFSAFGTGLIFVSFYRHNQCTQAEIGLCFREQLKFKKKSGDVSFEHVEWSEQGWQCISKNCWKGSRYKHWLKFQFDVL